MVYFSARLLFIVLVDDGRPRKRNHYDESIILFRARDFDHAFSRALELGRSEESRYENPKGQAVRWALVEIVELRRVGRRLDGEEVISEMFHKTTSRPIPFSTRFRPERSRPHRWE